MPVKDNHALLKKKIASFFASPALFEARLHRAQETTRGHGRLEVRDLTASADVPVGYLGFPSIAQVFCLTREVLVKKTGQLRQETVYGITSLSVSEASASRLLSLVRGHWTIENRSHYVRDVTFGEDVCRVRSGGAGQVLAALRNVCISLIRLSGSANVAGSRRYYAARPKEALHLIGCPITE